MVYFAGFRLLTGSRILFFHLNQNYIASGSLEIFLIKDFCIK